MQPAFGGRCREAANQLAAMIGKELGELEEANRELGTLGRFGYYKLK